MRLWESWLHLQHENAAVLYPPSCLHTRTLAFSTEDLDWQRLLLQSHRMVASSCPLWAKLPNHCSGGWERIVALLLIPLISHGEFSLLEACPAAISDRVSRFALAKNYYHSLFGLQHRNVFLCCAIACTAVSPSAHISKVTTIRSYVQGLPVAFLQLRYPDGSLFPMLMMHSLCSTKSKKRKVKIQLRGQGGFIAWVNVILSTMTLDWHTHYLSVVHTSISVFIQVLYCTRTYRDACLAPFGELK